MILSKYKTLIPEKHRLKVYFIFLSSLVAVFFEMISIGSIPVFVTMIIDIENLLKLLPDFLNIDFIFKFTNQQIIIFSSISLVLIFIIKNLILGIIIYFQGIILKILKEETNNKIYSTYIHSPYLFFSKTNPSVMIRTINSDVAQAYTYLLAQIKLYRELILVIIIFSLLIIIEPVIYILSFGLFSLTTLIFYYFYKLILKKRGERLVKKNAEKLKILNQTFLTIKEIKVLNKENFFLKIFKDNVKIVESLTFVSYFVSSLPKLVLEITTILSIAFFSAALIVFGKSEATLVPTLALLASASIRFLPAFSIITSSLSSIRFLRPSFNIVTNSLKALETNLISKHTDEKLNPIRLKNEIRLSKLSFSYERKIIFKDLNLKIKKGQSIGIIGESGKGKSTLINLLLGIIKPDKGKILVDDKDIFDNLSSWYQRIGYVPQEIYLLDDTIRNNVAFGLENKEIDEKKLKDSFQKSQLENFIENLPEKENCSVGNMGVKLSGGQKQRIGIARALYNNPDILILDEATSALDELNEKKNNR